jgi:hypothetical protein
LLDRARASLGRGPECDIRLPLPVISTHHLDIFCEAGRCFVVDVGSTNGTFLRGQRLAVGQRVELESGAMLRVVDVQLSFERGQPADEGFTIAESGTMVRQMVREALHQDQVRDDQAFFELLRGAPELGRRWVLTDELERALIGSSDEALVRLGALAPVALEIKRRGDGFELVPQPESAVWRNQAPVSSPVMLSSRDRLRVQDVELIFFDPLQDYLGELDGGQQATQPASQQELEQAAQVSAATTQQAPTITTGELPAPVAASDATQDLASSAVAAPKQDKAGLGKAELAILVASVVLILGGLGLAIMVFTSS